MATLLPSPTQTVAGFPSLDILEITVKFPTGNLCKQILPLLIMSLCAIFGNWRWITWLTWDVCLNDCGAIIWSREWSRQWSRTRLDSLSIPKHMWEHSVCATDLRPRYGPGDMDYQRLPTQWCGDIWMSLCALSHIWAAKCSSTLCSEA